MVARAAWNALSVGCSPLRYASNSVHLRLRCGISTELCEVLKFGTESEDECDGWVILILFSRVRIQQEQ
jgi:hypothetical protein